MTRRPLLRQAFVVARKELIDAFRDRRAIYAILFSAMFGPLLTGFILNRVADRQRTADEIRVPVVGAEHAPALVDWLRQQSGVTVVNGPANAEAAVRERTEAVVVVIMKDFAADFSASKPAEVRVVSDGSRDDTRPQVERVRTLLRRYGSEIGALRLVARGISPSIATALAVRNVEVSSSQQRAARILGMLPLFIVMAAFVGGMQIAMDSTAGERERGSLEPLLATPALRGAIAAGKWLAASAASMLAVGLTTVLCFVVLGAIPLQELGIRFRLDSGQFGAMLLAVLPVCPVAAALQMYLSTFARSFKEAQSYMGFLMVVPMLPGFVSIIYPMTSQLWMFPVPVVGTQALMTDVLGGKSTAPLSFLLAAAGALVFASVLVALTTALLRREKIIFGR